ncbi:MAG: Phosphoenolpyruvate-protein phosphotransferase of system [Frankiales bacterium]|nr:Phosphoenolpyruvate-protein phosphotransferase of system [Frankiales bacterium]
MADPLTGIGVSPGVAAGPVARVAPPPQVPADLPAPADPAAETALATAALDGVADDLERRAAEVTGESAQILEAQVLMARDPALADLVAGRIAAGAAAPVAVAAAFAEFRALLAAAGPYMAERVTDLDDLSNRAVARLLDVPMPGIPDPGHPFVLVATDLAPADTVSLDAGRVLAIVTELGGATSHTAILAKSLGLPAVVACAGAAQLADGERVLVDADAGTVLRAPDDAAVSRATGEFAARRQRLARATGPGRTADGVPVQLLVNIGGGPELPAAAAADAEGVGLFRTEFLFLDRPEPPSAEEQEESYARVFEAFAGRKVVVRTLDAGADKPLRFVTVPDEPNPALGVRGLRTARRHPELLEDQLAAVAAAAARTGADVWVMAPMVSVAAEARAFARLAHAAGLPVAGVMVEVPAAALRARQVLAGCDFASLGTNDLAQYAFASDRLAGELADLLDPWQPGLLDLVGLTAGAGHDLGKQVGVCGEAAGDPLLAPVLVGLGVTSLSMAPVGLPAVRAALAAHTLAECRDLAEVALVADGAAEARAAVRAVAHRS